MKPRKGQKIWRFLQKNPKAWCKGTLAYNARMKNGRPCDALNPKACQWCMLGLLNLFDHDINDSDDILCYNLGIFSLSIWNDAPETTVQDVIAAFKKAGL